MNKNGFFGVGIYHPKHEINQGTLWRSAYAFGASFVFTVGPRFVRQASDTPRTYLNIPMFTYKDLDDLIEHLPYSCPLIGVELDERASPLDRFVHPDRACYVLGAEDYGLPPKVLERCHQVVQIPGLNICLNVATMGSILLYDRRIQKVGTKTARRGSEANGRALSKTPR